MTPRLLRSASSYVRSHVFLPAFLVLGALATLWALASPLFAVPDEVGHATKAIALMHGDATGHFDEASQSRVVVIPEDYALVGNITCFAFNAAVSGECGTDVGGEGGATTIPNPFTSYNPTYYALVGWPTLVLDGEAGMYAMRIVSGLMSAALIAWGLSVALRVRRSPWLPAAIAFAAAPMPLFFYGSVNAQAFEIAAGVALWLGALSLFDASADDAEPRLRREMLSLILVSGALLANTRALGPLWVVLILVAVAIFAGRERTVLTLLRHELRWWGAAAAAVMLVAVLWTRSAGTLEGSASVGDFPLVGADFLTSAVAVAAATPVYVVQSVANFGWLDTFIPAAMYAIPLGMLALLAGLAIIAPDRRSARVTMGVAAMALAVPVVIQGFAAAKTGLIWQGRYGLWAYLGIAIVAAFALNSRDNARMGFLAARAGSVVALTLSGFGLYAYMVNLHRYVVGDGDTFRSMVRHAEWQPPGGWIALTLLAGISYLALWWALREWSRVEEDTPATVELAPADHA